MFLDALLAKNHSRQNGLFQHTRLASIDPVVVLRLIDAVLAASVLVAVRAAAAVESPDHRQHWL